MGQHRERQNLPSPLMIPDPQLNDTSERLHSSGTGIRNEAEIKRKARALDDRDKNSKSKGYGGQTDLQKSIQRLTQRTVKIIRWS